MITQIKKTITQIGVRRDYLRNLLKICVINIMVILITWQPACADVIYFKDGGRVEGAIQKEDDTNVTIDLGAGIMAVRRNEIEYIEKSSSEDEQRMEEENRKDEISRGEWAPPGYEDIRATYLKSKESKGSLKKLKAGSAGNTDDITRKEGKISESLKALDEKSRELKTIDSEKRTKEYNAVVAEMNSLNAQLNAENSELKTLHAEKKDIDTALMEKANKYRVEFQAFKDILNAKNAGVHSVEASAGTSTDELTFLDEMRDNMTDMDNDFKKDIIGYTAEGNQVIVGALINDIALTRLVVDTGASIVIISKETADRLGIPPEEGEAEEIEIIMANGTSVNARPVTLKSIKVDDAEVRDVRAAILENNAVGAADGLLGMSFLSNFIISVDTSSNKLILEQIL